MQEITYLGSKYHFAFQEYHSPFWLSFWSNEDFLSRYKEIAGTDIGFIYLVRNNELIGYMQAESSSILYESMKEKLTKEWVNQSLNSFDEAIRRLEILSYTLKEQDLSQPETQIENVAAIKKTIAHIFPYSNIFYLLSDIVEKELREGLSKTFNKEQQVFILEVASQPIKPTKLAQYNDDITKLAESIYSLYGGTVTETVITEYFQQKGTDDLKHLEQNYFSLTSINGEPRRAESFIPDILNRLQNFSPKKAFKLPSLSPELEHLVYLLRSISYFKDQTSSYANPYLVHGFMPLWHAIAFQLKLSYASLEELLVSDIKASLFETKEQIDNLVEERKRATFFYHESGKLTAVTEGDRAQSDIHEILLQASEPRVGRTDTLYGKVGSQGTVIGRVQKIESIHDIGTFEEGNILVAMYTAPEFVPIMKKSIGIITETGGITSHAAIVSRELGKPCVVNVKGAMSALKNGDLVELDATQGIIHRRS